MIKEIEIDSLDLENIEYDLKGNLKENGMIKKKIVCLRPGHKSGLPRIYSEIKNGKLISHNYGHSGTGYCFLFSTVETAIENFQKMRMDNGISFNEKITVIGMGCIGLVTSITLFYRGFRNIEIIGENYDSTPSQLAGGLFEFSLTSNYTKEQNDLMNQHFKHTFYEYQAIFEGKHKFINQKSLISIDYYTDFYDNASGLGYLAGLGLIPKGTSVVIKIRNTNNKFNMTHFKTFHIITDIFMQNLIKVALSLNIPMVHKKVNNFSDVKTSIIFNCTGLGSFKLNNDKDVHPICGHGFLLNKIDITKCNYILRFAKIQGLETTNFNGPLYYMPKTSGFIGGSYVKDYFGDDNITNEEYFDTIMKRANYVFKGIKPKF